MGLHCKGGAVCIDVTVFQWKNITFLLSELTFLAEWWSGLDIKLYGTKEDFDKLGKESAIIVSNHRSDVDWLIGYTLADRAGVLAVRTYATSIMYICVVNGQSRDRQWYIEYCFLLFNHRWGSETIPLPFDFAMVQFYTILCLPWKCTCTKLKSCSISDQCTISLLNFEGLFSLYF